MSPVLNIRNKSTSPLKMQARIESLAEYATEAIGFGKLRAFHLFFTTRVLERLKWVSG
ncbi:MAG: hypothetical protein ACKVK6_03980 [bacterium]